MRRWCLLVATGLGLFQAGQADAGPSRIRHVIVIAMENADAFPGDGDDFIYGNPDAPYINTELMTQAARADRFADPLPLNVPSEAHYVFMEAGANRFSDYAFTDSFDGNYDPSARRSTAETAHLATQIEATNGRVSWASYQEGMSVTTGACPINSDYDTHYAAKHNPFVFFRDIAGDPPSKANEACARRIRPYGQLGGDLAAGKLANYVFITPTLCHDMHDRCGANNRVAGGDAWLKTELPPILEFAAKNAALVLIVWDEGKETQRIPFLALGPLVKKGYASQVDHDHRAVIKTVERAFGLPLLDTVKDVEDLADLLQPGVLP